MFDFTAFLAALTEWFLGELQGLLLAILEAIFQGPATIV